MEVFFDIGVYSVMVLSGLGVLAAAFVFTGLALAEEGRAEEEHE